MTKRAKSERKGSPNGDASKNVEEDLQPCFLPDDGKTYDTPEHVTKTNIRELYGWQPGETLDEAIARKKAQEGK
jgi:hypothetical protein